MAGSRPVKILYCIDALLRGGTELQLKGLIDRLDRTRYQPFLLTIRPSDPQLAPRDCGHLAWHVPRLISPSGLAAAVRLARFLRRERFDVVQTFFQDSTIFGGTAARLAGVPQRLACFRDLGFWRTPAQTLLLHRVYPLMTGFLCNAEIVKQNFVEHDNLDPARITVIYNGLDVAALPWVEHTGPTLDVGLVGNLSRRVKRTDLFIEAAARVASRPEGADVRWHIIGDGEFRPEMEDLARRRGLGRRAVFTGRIADVTGYLETLQVGVLCSDSEGFSNALLEYMLKGCACVATDVGGNSEAIRDNETGLLVPADDADALADALTRLVRDVALRRRLATRARHFAQREFSWEKCLAAHDAVYTTPSTRP
ncbi:hypothetical protein CSB20_03225 [bacterium DOLZORAL124_64_63]|nr:MAG: hypothetical protein CSB20_03225 [bacterium DOLZORAL124_64_63]